MTETTLKNWDEVTRYIAKALKDSKKDIEIKKSKDGYKVFEITRKKIFDIEE